MAPKKEPKQELIKEELVPPESKAVQEALIFYTFMRGGLVHSLMEETDSKTKEASDSGTKKENHSLVKEGFLDESWESRSVETVYEAYDFLRTQESQWVRVPKPSACRSLDREEAVDEASAIIDLLSDIKRHPLVDMPDPMTDEEVKSAIRQFELNTRQEIRKKTEEIEELTTVLHLERGTALQSWNTMNAVKGSEIAARARSQQALTLGVRIADNDKLVEELRRQLKDKGGDAEKTGDAVHMDSSGAHATVSYDTDGAESYVSSDSSDFGDDDGGGQLEGASEEFFNADEGVAAAGESGKEEDALSKRLAECDTAGKPLEESSEQAVEG